MNELTQEQKRVLIATACGIYLVEEDGLWTARGPRWHNYKVGISREHAERVALPDYFGSLDAMHEAEKTLTGYDPQAQDSAYGRYITELQRITGWWRTPSATAAQRAESFGRTLGLWS